MKIAAVASVAAAFCAHTGVAFAETDGSSDTISYETWGTTTVAETPETWSTCNEPRLKQPFAQFGDYRDYVLAPQGAFENTDAPGWQLRRESDVVAGNEQFYLRKASDRRSLSIGEGSSVISPAMCVGLDYPTARLVTKSVRRSLLEGGTGLPPLLRIEVIYPATGALFQEVATLDPLTQGPERRGWRVSADVSLLPELAELGPGSSRIALRFTAVTGDWKIDDLFIDPRRHS